MPQDSDSSLCVWQSHSDRHSYTLGHSHRRTEDSAFAVAQPHRNRQCQAALANICFGIALITLPFYYPCEGLRKIQQITASQRQFYRGNRKCYLSFHLPTWIWKVIHMQHYTACTRMYHAWYSGARCWSIPASTETIRGWQNYTMFKRLYSLNICCICVIISQQQTLLHLNTRPQRDRGFNICYFTGSQ